jgi:hypothetical protein
MKTEETYQQRWAPAFFRVREREAKKRAQKLEEKRKRKKRNR